MAAAPAMAQMAIGAQPRITGSSTRAMIAAARPALSERGSSWAAWVKTTKSGSAPSNASCARGP